MPTILTLDINYDADKHGPWPVRRRMIAQALRRSEADVAALQSVRKRGDGLDQAAELADEAGYAGHYFCPAEEESGGALGSAFLSRVPVEDIGFLGMAPGADSDDRSWRLVLHAAFRWPEGRVSLFNAHFSWVEEQARRQVARAVMFMGSYPGPSLAVGDFNAAPDSRALEPLRAAGWTDAWASLRHGDDGFTYESNAPDRRIDYVWAGPGMQARLRDIRTVTAQAYTVPSSPVLASRGSVSTGTRTAIEPRPRQSAVRLSDHLGLVLRFSLPR